MENIDRVSFGGGGGSAAAAGMEECGHALNLSVGGKIDPASHWPQSRREASSGVWFGCHWQQAADERGRGFHSAFCK